MYYQNPPCPPNHQHLWGSTTLRDYAASCLINPDTADCQVCYNKVSLVVASVPESVLYLIIASSDVLSHNRVNVTEEKSERVIWYKV